MRKVFLIIGTCSFLAAAGLVVSRGNENPFSNTRKWWLSNKKLHGIIYEGAFSPDGEKLLIAARNDSGETTTRDLYVYLLNERTLTRLTVTLFDGFVSWAPDSRRIAFNQPEVRNRYIETGRIFDTEQNRITERFKIPFGGWRQPWSPDGQWQVFSSQLHVYAKETGRPVWLEVPMEPHYGIPFWNYNGKTIIWYRSRILYTYDIEERRLNTIRTGDWEISSLLYCSPYANEAFVLTSRKQKEYSRVVLRRVDLDTGQFSYSFDSGLDPEGNSLAKVFIPPRDNQVYFSTYQYAVKGKTLGEPSKLVLLDMTTGETKTLFSGGGYRLLDYCGSRDLFTVTSKDDGHKVLYLFDARSGSVERIFPLE